VSGIYTLQNNPFPGNPITINPGFSFSSTINVVPTKVEWHVAGVVTKESKAFGETDEAGVTLTLTSQTTNISYSAISDSLGQFTFLVPPGDYDYSVGGGYKFKNPFAGPLSVTGNVSFPTAFVVVPSEGVFYNVIGNVQKSPMLPGETDESGVKVQLKSADLNAPILETMSSPNGWFRFKVPAQTYSIRVDGSYELSSVPAPVAISADYNFGTLVVNPSNALKAKIYGKVTPGNLPETYEVRLWDNDNSQYIRTVNSIAGTGDYAFSEVPPGNYLVFALPVRNGFFAESSATIAVGPGDSILENLTAAAVGPLITTHTFTGVNLLDLSGNRFLATSGIPSETEVFVDGNLMNRPMASDLTDTQDRADLSNVTPGKHKAVLKKNWTLAATGQNFVLSSNEINIDKPIGPPTNLVWSEVKDTEIEVTWKNAPFTQFTEVEIWDVLAATQVGATVTISETSYEFTGLTPSTSYEVRLRNRAGTVVSQPLTGTTSTKSAAAYQVQTISLVDSGNLLSQGTALDFVAAEGKFFVAHTQSTDLYITGYSADGTASQSQLVFASAAAPS
ncbi:MAG: fibronectin type III domain-containing protein, partial [Candidatus Riflebacteria bacterium]